MKGAREFHQIINGAVRRKLGGLERHKLQGDYRYGNILFSTGEHARGYTFQIFLIDGDDKLEVYGVIGGQPGWTEYYGWKMKGTWVKPILQYLRNLDQEIQDYDEERDRQKRESEREKNKVIGEKVQKFNDMFRLEGVNA